MSLAARGRRAVSRCHPGRSTPRTALQKHVDFFDGSKAEFGLLLDIAGEDRNGKTVLSRERLARFYNGSLFYELADNVARRRASERASLSGAVSTGLRGIY